MLTISKRDTERRVCAERTPRRAPASRPQRVCFHSVTMPIARTHGVFPLPLRRCVAGLYTGSTYQNRTLYEDGTGQSQMFNEGSDGGSASGTDDPLDDDASDSGSGGDGSGDGGGSGGEDSGDSDADEKKGGSDGDSDGKGAESDSPAGKKMLKQGSGSVMSSVRSTASSVVEPTSSSRADSRRDQTVRKAGSGALPLVARGGSRSSIDTPSGTTKEALQRELSDLVARKFPDEPTTLLEAVNTARRHVNAADSFLLPRAIHRDYHVGPGHEFFRSVSLDLCRVARVFALCVSHVCTAVVSPHAAAQECSARGDWEARVRAVLQGGTAAQIRKRRKGVFVVVAPRVLFRAAALWLVASGQTVKMRGQYMALLRGACSCLSRRWCGLH